MLTVYSEDHRGHAPKYELTFGEFLPCFEKPSRAEMVLARVKEVGLGEVVAPEDFGRAPLARVHTDAFLDFLEAAWGLWTQETGSAADALPEAFVTRGLRQVVPESIYGKLGYYAIDCAAPITAGTWAAARASANAALTAQRQVAEGAVGNGAAFALCRPPGHHASADTIGGYCYLNNAAITAQAFRDQGAERVAILDVDYHGGNGTQSIFYRRADVLFASLHGHPKTEYPYYLGYAEETGEGEGEGANLNYPLEQGTEWPAYAEALDDACARIDAYGPDALVISLGVDTFKEDPISKFKLESGHYPRIGEKIAALKRPTVFLMEGGYAVEEIGINAVGVLTGFEGSG